MQLSGGLSTFEWMPARKGSTRRSRFDHSAEMNRVPDEELVLVPGGSLITETPEEGRALAPTLARHPRR
jgi:hypothetical protein